MSACLIIAHLNFSTDTKVVEILAQINEAIISAGINTACNISEIEIPPEAHKFLNKPLIIADHEYSFTELQYIARNNIAAYYQGETRIVPMASVVCTSQVQRCRRIGIQPTVI